MDSQFDVTIDRAVAGGRMLGRRDGPVVLVAGAVPGERVRVEVERSTSHVTWARVVEVIEPSPDRRVPPFDSSCGGLAYAHIDYARQCALKSEVIADAFRRVGKITLEAPVPVVPSLEQAYRMRARLHVRDGRFGFFREHSHELCDAGASGQLHPQALASVGALLAGLGRQANRCQAVIVGENIHATERVLHLESIDDNPIDVSPLGDALPEGVTGVSTWLHGRVHAVLGEERVADRAADLFPGMVPLPVDERIMWRRTAASFFQGNRYLLGALLAHVLAETRGTVVADLYAGVGLFSVAIASRGVRVLAIEGDRTSAADLAINAAAVPSLEPHRGAVEHAARRLRPGAFETVVLDPPRSGLSKEAMSALLGLAPRRIVFVSCDVPTLARDAAKLTASGYQIENLKAFDMFPNTGHVETVAVLGVRV